MIYVMGGGTSKFFGAIGVVYPEGSTCTCTGKNTGKKLKAKDTSGQEVFAVPEADIWTIQISKIVDGVETGRTTTVEINGRIRCVNITMNYELVLFNGGDNTEETGGWDYSETKQYGGNEYSSTVFNVGTTLEYKAGNNYNGEGTDTLPRKGIVYNKKALDLKGYSRLRVVSKEAGATLRIGTSQMDNIVASMDLSVGGNAIEISHLSKEYYYYISIDNNADGNVAYPIKISEMVLE